MYEPLRTFGLLSQVFNKPLLLSTNEKKKTFIHINLIVIDSFAANLIKFTLIHFNLLQLLMRLDIRKIFFSMAY